MLYVNPIINEDTSIDLYAGNDRSYRELLPLWDALGERRGTFFASRLVHQNGAAIQYTDNGIDSDSPIVISNYKDLNDIFIACKERPFIMFENEHNSETRGLLNIVSLFLCKDQKMSKLRKAYSKNVSLFDTAQSAARLIFEFCKGKEPEYITEVNGKSVGIIYMVWGDKALQAAKRSIATLKQLGYCYPAAFIGQWKQNENWTKGHGVNVICSIDPFDKTKQRGFQFRAGRIKPLLYELSPFDYTLYLDADTSFLQPIQSSFELLNDFDLIVTDEKLSLAQLYNKKLAGWELNMLERDSTIIELNGDDGQPFVNSGVFFFRKNNITRKLFADWSKEWLRFQEWDEQLALMRAIYKNDAIVKHLPVEWNSPSLNEKAIIFHNYGRGEVRINV